MTPSTSNTPAIRVFSIPELAEDIILRLPPCDILRLQRTCCVLRDTINETSAIQELLFLQPITRFALYPFPRPPPRSVTTPTAVTLNSSGVQWASVAAPGVERHPIENPFLRLLNHGSEAHNCLRFNRKEASWRRMLVSQPPIKSLLINAANRELSNTWITPGSDWRIPDTPSSARDGSNLSSNTATIAYSAQNCVTLGDLDAHLFDTMTSIRSWCLWSSFKDWDQLSAVASGSHDRLDERFLVFELGDHEATSDSWKRFETQLRH